MPQDSKANSSNWINSEQQQLDKQMGWHTYRQNYDQYKPQPSPAQAANLSFGGDMKHLLRHLVQTDFISVESLAVV